MDERRLRPVKDIEKRNRVAEALTANPARSDRIIARETKVSQSTAFRVRCELETKGIIAQVSFENRLRKPAVRKHDPRLDILREELRKDPRRSNGLIGDLVGYYSETVSIERARMEAAHEIPEIPPAERLNLSGGFGKGTGRGAETEIPEGMTFMEAAAKGADIEAANPDMNMDDVAVLVGIADKGYRRLRTIYLLSRRNDLKREDADIVRGAIMRMEKEKQILQSWLAVEPIAKKIWGNIGPGGAGVIGAKKENKRRQAFDHAVGLITDMCSRALEVDVPYLVEEEQIKALHKVNEAISCLKKLSVSIRRARG